MPTEKLTFQGHNGDQLAARLDLPAGPHLATALFAHCFTCSKDIPAAKRIAQRLAAQGIAVLRFDFTGLGHSEGEFANTNFSTNLEDLKAACAALSERGLAPDMLIGHSLGGRPFVIRKDFLEDISTQTLDSALSGLNKALLVLHAPLDEVVSIDNAAQIFLAAKHPKSFVTLDKADHLISRAEEAEYAAEVIASWAGRYLDLRPPAPPPGAPEGITRVSEADPSGFLQDIMSGPRHHALADEPEAYGGTNKGMSPYGFLASGLGACTSMTIRMYARRKGWPLEHVSVDVSHSKVHAQDAGGNAGDKIDSFRREITLTGDLGAEQRQKLLEIADKCPVHRTLERSSKIETVLSA